MILLAILSSAFFIRWGLPLYLFLMMPWRCKESEWIWPRPYFIAAEVCFAMAGGAGISGVMNGWDTLLGEGLFFLAGMFFRDWVRMGLANDGTDEVFLDKVFNPWGIAKI